ncbi:MAG TPA: gamma-glutamyltransferase [Longimicrobiales bacterium]|nr:gamma-glutamyltransferase [Longimicrobiales bacterium]
MTTTRQVSGIPTLRTFARFFLTAGLAALVGCATPGPAGQPPAVPGPAPSAPAPTAADIAGAVPADWPYAVAAQPSVAQHAMVASDASLASEVGARILQAGGNAVDAAVATAFALAAVYPEAGNIGGGGFMVIHMADGTDATLDFREEAPGAASRNMYLDSAGNLTDRSLVGYTAMGVPGSVAGLWAAHQRFGSMPWRELVAPAIALAQDGFIINDHVASTVADNADKLRQFSGSAALFLPGGQPLRAGTLWRNPDLAAVLRRIADQGADGFYRGKTADLIVQEMQRGGGLITKQDLAAYQARWRDPVTFTYRGYDVVSMPPASSGGITLALIANIMDGYDLRALGWHSPEALHLVTEAMRRAFADRNHYLGDPDFVDIPRQRLLSTAYADQRRAGISRDHATRSSDVHPGLGGANIEGPETTNFAVVDDKGDAVATTTTINFLYGSGVTVTGAGFLLNDEMDDFAAEPGKPNAFGLVQGEANAIQPGKRPLSAMTPTIVLGHDGRPMLVTGARGGPTIITAVYQIMSNVIDYGMGIEAAVATPRIHHQHLPDTLYYEQHGLTRATIQALTAMGHHVAPRRGYVGEGPSILRVGEHWTGTADPRLGGGAVGY